MNQRYWGFLLGTFILAAAASCDRDAQSPARKSSGNDCHRYDPTAAKQTFDGRVGGLVVRNASARPIDIVLYHPDGSGSAELGWKVPANATADLGNGFGNDWGIRAGTSCATRLGRTGRWSEGQFVIAWRGNSLIAGDVIDAAQPTVPAEALLPAVLFSLPDGQVI